jgi:cytoskeletal protein RodZ
MSTHVGHELKKVREAKGLTLEKAAKDTCLRPGYLCELEECNGSDEMPDVYRKLSLRMYARYLGVPFETTRRAVVTDEGTRIAPVGMFVRRMGRPPKVTRHETGPRTQLLSLAKSASAIIVAVLAVGLWSLNAKLSRLDSDDQKPHPPLVIQSDPRPFSLPLVLPQPSYSLDEHRPLVLVPTAP